jgi:RNA polymerase sigma factor (sigma-70 family)
MEPTQGATAEKSEYPSNDERRARALRDLVVAVVLGAMHPLSRRELLRAVDLQLRDAWTDVTGLEVEAALDALDDERIHIDLNGRFHAVEMPGSIDESLPHWVAAARAVEALEETEGSDCETLRNRQFGELLKQPLLEPHAEKMLGSRAGIDRNARNELVERNLRLVRALAGRWERSTAAGIDGDDLFQEACLGVIRAAEKFDPQRGFRFSTYATWWIRQSLARAVDAHSRTIRIPVHISDRIRNVSRARQRLLDAHPEREPTEADVCRISGVSAAHLLEVERARAIACVPLEVMTPDQELRVVSVEEDDKQEELFGQAAIDRALEALLPREADVLRRRLGLNGEAPSTLDAIGLEIGVTRERVRQIETAALKSVATQLGLDTSRSRRLRRPK